jgi:Glycosyltransferase family 87
MGIRMRALWPPAIAAAVCAATLGAMGLLTPAFTDYELEAEASIQALREGDLAGFLDRAPAYGGSVVLRAPFAFLPNLWGGGDLALFRSMAFPCLLAGAALAVFLWARGRSLGRPASSCWIALILVAGCPMTLRALEIGHPEELLGAVLCVGAAIAAGARRPLLSGVLLGLALANKPWAVLAVVPVLAIAPEHRPRLLAAAAAVAAVVMLPLALAGSAVEQAGDVARTTGVIFQPWQVWWFLGDTGQVVMGNFGEKADFRVPPAWLSGIAHPLLVAVPVAASLALVPRVRRQAWHQGLLLLAFAFLLRCVLDPWNTSYYHVPFLIALVAWELHEFRRPPVLAMGATLLTWITLVTLPRVAHPDVQSLAYLAWSVPLVALLAARLVRPERDAGGRAWPQWVRARGAAKAGTLGLLLALVALGAAPTSASAQADSVVAQTVAPASMTEPPPGFRISAREARRISDAHPEVRSERAEHPSLERVVEIPLYRGPVRQFEVTYVDRGTEEIVADVFVDGVSGEVLEAWTGPQASTFLARGEQPPVGRSLNEWYVWFPLAALFLLPFLDPRRPLRLVHLDLVVLLAFGLSQIWFNRGQIDVSVPMVYPLLAYLLIRMLLAGFRPRERPEPLIPYARVSWLAAGLVLLVTFRIVLNLVDSSVIDVGYASVVGADRIAHGEELYVLNDVNGDTYGPINYLAYVPFELLFPWDGTWDFVPAAHAAAITFDLLAIVGLMLLGARLRSGREGRTLGLALGWAWAAYPFTLYALQGNTNDALVAVLIVAALLALRSPPVRGLMVGLAGAAKFAPLALAPLLATGLGDVGKRRAWPAYAGALVGVCALAVALYLPDGGLREFYDTTIGYQLGRDSPFSLWGLHPSLAWLQEALKVGALLLGVAVAFVPGRRDARQVAALGAAVLIAVQLPATHWFYFYLVWITPLVLLASFGAYRGTGREWTDGLVLGAPRAKGFERPSRSTGTSQRPR